MAKNTRPDYSWDESRQRWRKRVKNPATGKYTNVYGKTKAECREKAAARVAELADEVSSTGTLVWEYARQWYTLNTASLSSKRREDYRNAINNHICPAIGNKRLDDVRLDDGLAILKNGPASKSAQQKIVTTLKRMFTAAADNELIRRSPFDSLKAGGTPPAEKKPLTKEQQSALIAAVQGLSIEPFVQLCLYAGLRREEALGLMWQDVHLDAVPPYLDVRRACSWGGKNQAVVTEQLKSAAARRSIPLPPPLAEHLAELRQHTKSQYVVCNQSGGAMSATGFRRAWGTIAQRTVREGYKLGDTVRNSSVIISLDFHVTPHQLRHTYITELIMAGADIKTVQYLAGHATVSLTLNIYTHLMANRPEDTAAQVLKAFSAQSSRPPEHQNPPQTQ